LEKNLKRSLIISGIVVGGIIIASTAFVAYFLIENTAYRITSGAMEPTLKVNDAVMVDKTVPFDALEVDDIIVFLRPSGHDRTIVMRIVDISTNSEGERTIRTKGDANPASIPGTDFPITEKEYIGRVYDIIRP